MLYGERDASHASLLHYPEIREQPHPAGRLEQDLRHDRLAPGLWDLAGAPLSSKVTRLAINCHSCVNAAAQHAGITALCGPQDAVSEMRAAFDARRRFIFEEINKIPGLNCVDPGGAFYAFPNIAEPARRPKSWKSSSWKRPESQQSPGRLSCSRRRFPALSYANSLANIDEALHACAVIWRVEIAYVLSSLPNYWAGRLGKHRAQL